MPLLNGKISPRLRVNFPSVRLAQLPRLPCFSSHPSLRLYRPGSPSGYVDRRGGRITNLKHAHQSFRGGFNILDPGSAPIGFLTFFKIDSLPKIAGLKNKLEPKQALGFGNVITGRATSSLNGGEGSHRGILIAHSHHASPTMGRGGERSG